jgi:hypothetical protein
MKNKKDDRNGDFSEFASYIVNSSEPRYMQPNEKLSLKYTIALRVRSMGPTGFPGIKYEIRQQYIGSEGLTDEMIEKAITEMVRDGIIEQYDDMAGQYVSGPNMENMELPENKFELR